MTTPPKPPSFELPPGDPRDWWYLVTDEDRKFLEQLDKEGRLPGLIQGILADAEEEREKWAERVRRLGLDPDVPPTK